MLSWGHPESTYQLCYGAVTDEEFREGTATERLNQYMICRDIYGNQILGGKSYAELTVRRILLRRVDPPCRRGVFSVTETLLVSLRTGPLLWNVGESGLEEGSGESGGPIVIGNSSRWCLRALVGDILGVGAEVEVEVEIGNGVEIRLGLH